MMMLHSKPMMTSAALTLLALVGVVTGAAEEKKVECKKVPFDLIPSGAVRAILEAPYSARILRLVPGN